MLLLSRTRISFAVIFGITALLFAALVAPATAQPKDTRSDRAGKASAPAYTEDNDTNDGTKNNVVDDGDNAHPSGKDRSVENGRSGNQGKAKADPDDDGRGPERTNGGVDQPNGKGGVDKADQDGNNGCGNDDDFEDDNEGRCGGSKAAPAKPTKPSKPSTGGPDKPSKPSKPGKPATPSKPGKPNTPKQPNNPGKPGKINICHRTGSMTNPYVFITVSENATHGHAGHDGDVIGVNSAADCPESATTPDEPPVGGPLTPVVGDEDDDTDVGGVIVVRPPGDDEDNDGTVIVHQPRRPTPTVDRSFDRPEVRTPDRVLASTGSRTTILASIAALTLMMGAGLLGIRRFALKQ